MLFTQLTIAYIKSVLSLSVTGESAKRKIKDVKVSRKISLQHIIMGMDDSLSARLLEPPEITMPAIVHEKFTFNDALLDSIRKSLQEFLQKNARDLEKSDSTGFQSVTLGKNIKTDENDTMIAEISPVKVDLIKPKKGTKIAEEERLNRIKTKTEKVEIFINAATYADLPVSSLYSLTWHLGKTYAGENRILGSHIELYVDLLGKYALTGQWEKIQELLSKMNTANVILTPQVYMLVLDCLGRLPQSGSNSKKIESCINQAKNQVKTHVQCIIFH